jgi:hypothetical protein
MAKTYRIKREKTSTGLTPMGQPGPTTTATHYVVKLSKRGSVEGLTPFASKAGAFTEAEVEAFEAFNAALPEDQQAKLGEFTIEDVE